MTAHEGDGWDFRRWMQESQERSQRWTVEFDERMRRIRTQKDELAQQMGLMAPCTDGG